MNDSQAASILQLLEQLANLAQTPNFGQNLSQTRTLVEPIRANSLELADWVGQAQGRAAQRGLLRRLFRLGVFDSPPISGAAYSAWQRLQTCQAPEISPTAPSLSVLMPIYQPNLQWLQAAVHSVLSQPYPHLELCLADDNSQDPELGQYLQQLQATDQRVKCVVRAQNGHISAATNSALDLAGNDWCVLLDQDDLLAAHSLAWLGAWLERQPKRVVAVFSDEDKIQADGTGELFSPLFKPGFDPDLLLACNCVSHLGVYRTEALRGVSGLRPGYEGVQDHDLCLRLLAKHGPEAFAHVPRMLYHWRQHQDSTATHQDRKPYVQVNGLKMRADYAQSQCENSVTQAEILIAPRPDSGFFEVSFKPVEPRPAISLLVLENPVFSAWPEQEQAAWLNLVDRQLDAYGPAKRVMLNHAGQITLINQAARQTAADTLILLQAGDLPLHHNWLASLAGAICREGVGVAGCRTVKQNNFIIQAGYAVSRSPLPACGLFGDGPWLCPAYAGLSLESPGYFGFAHLLHSVLAVGLSGLCVKRELFLAAKGLDQDLGDHAVVDLCLRLWQESGLRSLILPAADLRSQLPADILPVQGLFARRWARLLRDNPPWQNPHLDWTPGGWRLIHPKNSTVN